MSFLQSLIDKGKGLLDSFLQEPRPVSTEAVIRNQFDRNDWADARKAIPAMDAVATSLAETVDYAEDFLGDLHALFLKQEPQLRDVKEMDPTRVPNREVLAHLAELPEVVALRQHSRGDRYASAMAMSAMQEVVTETLNKAQEAAAEAEAKRAEQEAARQAAADALQQALEAAENGDPGDLEARMDQFANTPAPDPSAAQEAADNVCKGMVNRLANAAQEASDDLDEEAAAIAAYGTEEGELAKMDMRQRMELAAKVRGSRLYQFAAILGQFKRVQRAAYRTKVKDAHSETHNVTTGNDLTRMATSEWLNFAAPELEMLLFKRWSEHALLVTDVRGRERQGRGPIIYVCDESASMDATDVAGGSREAWSKALGLALLDQAKREKRDFVYIGFGNETQQYVVEFPNGQATLDKVMTMTEHFFNGGTHFEKPLLLALKHIQARGADKPRPDIVFATDDEYKGKNLPESFMREWNTTKDKWSLKCYGIAIGCTATGSLATVSDNVRSVTSLVDSDPAKLADLFRTI